MPSLDVNATNIIGAAAIVGALAFLGRTAVVFLRMAGKIDQLFPVLMQIASEFKSNSGSTLRDRIVAIEKHMLEQDIKLVHITDQLNKLRPQSD